MGLNVGYLKSDTTDNGNEMYTPYYAVEPIIKYLPKDKIIWCPFDEEWSAFYNRLKETGFKVVRSSLAEGQDFFKYEPDKWDIIVSNPPFNIKDKILERLYSFNKPFAILLPMNSLQGKTRFKYFKQGIQLLSFDSRIAFHNKDNMDKYIKGTPFATAYFCRDLLPHDLILERLIECDKPLINQEIKINDTLIGNVLNINEIQNEQHLKWLSEAQITEVKWVLLDDNNIIINDVVGLLGDDINKVIDTLKETGIKGNYILGYIYKDKKEITYVKKITF